ncbi:MAG: molybdopterin-dependent oxidoreductase [Burkholderiaceae bacterium]|nr:molybdopterin-dependent oxidoreductase [Burkholderiaceae bacterium]
MLYAVINQSPVLGGTVQSTPSQPAGTLAVINLGNAVAVVATGTWAAFKAAREMSVSWAKPADAAQMDSVAIAARARDLMAGGTPAVAVRNGDAAGMLQGNQGALELTYELPWPMTLSRIRAVVDSAGDITAWSNRIVAPSITAQRRPLPASGVDSSAVEGANDIPYAIGSTLVEFVRHDAPVPVGYWRSVGHSINAFAVESAIDELAARVGMDPLAFRRRLLAGSPRLLAVPTRRATGRRGQPLAADAQAWRCTHLLAASSRRSRKCLSRLPAASRSTAFHARSIAERRSIRTRSRPRWKVGSCTD